MQDNSNVDEHGNPIVHDEGDELTKERYKQIVAGKDALAEKQRNVIVTAFKDKDLGKAMRALAEAEPKVLASVLKETGFTTIEEYEASLKVATPQTNEDEIRKAYEKFEAERQSKSAQERIQSQFKTLPEDIRDTAEKEFAFLIEGRNLTAEQTEEMARKAVALANATTGSKHQIDFAKMAFSSTGSMSSVKVTERQTDPTDDIIASYASSQSHPFWSMVTPPKS